MEFVSKLAWYVKSVKVCVKQTEYKNPASNAL